MDRMRNYLTAMCTGWDVQQIRDIVNETLHEIIDPLVYNEAVELIAEHKAAGRDVVIISSSGDEVVRPIGEMVGADHVIATRMVVADGRYTGEIEFYAYGPHKAEGLLATGRRTRLRPGRQLRLLRLDHRPADARGGRASVRGQPGQGAAPGRRRTRLAGPGLHQRGAAARTAVRPATTATGHQAALAGAVGRAGGAGLVQPFTDEPTER